MADEERRQLDEEKRRLEQERREFEAQKQGTGQKKKGGCLRWALIIFGVLILFGACTALITDDDTLDEDGQEASTEEEVEEEGAAEEATEDEEATDEEAEVTETESGEQEESASEDEDVVEEEEAEEVVGVGEPLEVDGIEFTVNEWYQADTVGTDFMTSEANDTYIVMEVTVTNNENEAITVDSDFFKIIEGERVFEPDSSASMDANEDDLGLFLEEINPGSSRTASVVFDVTQDVVDSDEKQLQVQSGFWGTQTGIINLQ
ncbi:DUF4352 domain-containing protein [Lacicoccus alkaliphilus]|uniref:DUF4352 domain-containing protein n=1 Tax=Lacicoccus alkaliphilus DSM 16010 TaxID=1123231 RepID=A0A1M7ABL0_9BACL|nr:DUF4352 domain-containing protein [Salinicoccus alkaliphilus]SHL40141.1 protein of unknown function [Salinicoccus alkaliphilus DSM 16010]